MPIEDGVELGVVLEGNLVINVLPSPGPIRSDFTAACFWAASGSNNWLNNVCSSAASGYWLQVKNKQKKLIISHISHTHGPILVITSGAFAATLVT